MAPAQQRPFRTKGLYGLSHVRGREVDAYRLNPPRKAYRLRPNIGGTPIEALAEHRQ
jgi:hypothetical protein